MQIYVRVKAAGKRKDVLAPVPYLLPDGTDTLRALLIAVCETEVGRYNRKQENSRLFPLLTDVQIEELADGGRVSFGEIRSEKQAVRETAVQNVLQCFADGLVRVFMNETELTDLDAPLAATENAVFTFVRLTFLAGRMW